MIFPRLQSGLFISYVHRKCRVPSLILDQWSLITLKRKKWDQIFDEPLTGTNFPLGLTHVPETLTNAFNGWDFRTLVDTSGEIEQMIPIRKSFLPRSAGKPDLYGESRQERSMDDVYRRFRSSCTLQEFADWFEDPSGSHDQARMYLAGVPLTKIVPQGLDVVLPRDLTERKIPNCPIVYFGRGSQQTPLHFDPTCNLTIVLRGEKTFTLFPPSSSADLEPVCDIKDIALSWYGRWIPAVYSKLAVEDIPLTSIPHVKFIVKAGEAAWIPSCWWHSVTGSEEQNGVLVYGFGNRM